MAAPKAGSHLASVWKREVTIGARRALGTSGSILPVQWQAAGTRTSHLLGILNLVDVRIVIHH